MATLEKIRKRSVLLIVVIGVALIAFIIGDFFTSGRTFFGNATTVAKVGGNKIDIHEFQKRYEEANQQMQQQNQNVDPALIQQQVLNQMIQEALLNKEVDALDITVSEKELSEAMTGKNASPMMVQFAQQMGAQSPAQLYDMLFNPSNYGIPEEQVAPARAMWLKQETEMENQLKYQKLAGLIAGSIKANDLDKQELNQESSTNTYLSIVKKDYSTLKDAQFPVTDAELQAKYNENKEKYKLEKDLRRIHYIALDIKPSKVDEDAALKVVTEAANTLRTTAGIDAIRNNNDLFINQHTVRLSDITNPKDKGFVEGAAVGDLSETSHIGDTYSMVKLLSKKSESDSLKVNMVGVEGAKAVQDSVLKKLNSGTTLADIKKVKGVQGAEGDQWIPLLQIGADGAEAKTKLLNAGSEYFILNSTDKGALIYQVTEKKAPKQMYEIAEVSYKVIPSETTVQNLRDKLQSFITANGTSANFEKNAVSAGFQAVEAMITSEYPQIDRIPYTRKAIQWVFGAKEGNVSPIFDKENNDKMIVASLDEIIPAGYMPITDKNLRAELTNLVRHDKKAAKLIAQYKGKAKDINGYAAIMGATVDTTSVSFGQQFIPLIGMEPIISGRASVAKANTLVGPLKGNNGVYVFTVTRVDNKGPKLSAQESAARYSRTLGGQAVMQRAIDILRKSSKVENDLIKFY